MHLSPLQCTYIVHILGNALDDLYAGWQSGAWSWWRHLLPWIGATWWETLPHTMAQPHSHTAHSIITQHTALSHPPRPNAEPSVKDADQLAKSLFIRRRIPAKNCAAYICSDFETTLPFSTPEYVTVVLCSLNHSWLPYSTFLYLEFNFCSITKLKEQSRDICYLIKDYHFTNMQNKPSQPESFFAGCIF